MPKLARVCWLLIEIERKKSKYNVWFDISAANTRAVKKIAITHELETAAKRVRTPRRFSHLSSSYRCRKNVFYFVCSTRESVRAKIELCLRWQTQDSRVKNRVFFIHEKNGWKMCVIRDQLRKISRMLAHTTQHREFHRLLLSLVARHTSIRSHSFNRSSFVADTMTEFDMFLINAHCLQILLTTYTLIYARW